MYSILLQLHSLVRWFVLISLLYAIYRSYRGWWTHMPFTPHDNFVRIAAATISHIQLTIGIWMYCISPHVRYLFHDPGTGIHIREIRFFGMEHPLMMLVAVVFITIGSSIAKRKNVHEEKFRTISIWFSIALFIILMLIPWPFSPLTAQRPYFRSF